MNYSLLVMIRFTRREDYAVILVNTLAKSYKKRLVPLSEVAAEYNISQLFLRNLASDLREAGIIKAVEGKNGGYHLVKAPEEIVMKDILSVFEKPQQASCCPKDSKGQERVCPKQNHCVANTIWRELNNEFRDKIYNLTLNEFLHYKSSQHTNT